VKSRGLKYKLISIAIAAGLCISATLFSLEYIEYRQSAATRGVQGEQSLLAAETRRLEMLASDLAAANAAMLENALSVDEQNTIEQTVDAMLKNPSVVGVTVYGDDGTIAHRRIREDVWSQTLAPEERRTIKRTLGALQAVGAVEVTVGRPGLLASGAALRDQLEQ
jgi:hypothetical protein